MMKKHVKRKISKLYLILSLVNSKDSVLCLHHLQTAVLSIYYLSTTRIATTLFHTLMKKISQPDTLEGSSSSITVANIQDKFNLKICMTHLSKKDSRSSVSLTVWNISFLKAQFSKRNSKRTKRKEEIQEKVKDMKMKSISSYIKILEKLSIKKRKNLNKKSFMYSSWCNKRLAGSQKIKEIKNRLDGSLQNKI